MIFELVGVLVDEAALKVCTEEAATGVDVRDRVVFEGVEMARIGLLILVGSRTGMIRLLAVILTSFWLGDGLGVLLVRDLLFIGIERTCPTPLIGVDPLIDPRPVELIREMVGVIPPRPLPTGTGVIFNLPPLLVIPTLRPSPTDIGVFDFGGLRVTFTSIGGF